MQDSATSTDQANAAVAARIGVIETVAAPRTSYRIECRSPDGELRWAEEFENTVMTAGKVDLLEKYFRSGVASPAWYMLLIGTGAIAAADTLASKAWSEVTAYAGSRPAITWNAAAANSANGRIIANAITFTMNASFTVQGAGICTVASGTAGILYAAGAFADARSGGPGDTIAITETINFS